MRIADILKVEFDEKRIYGLDILRACAILFVLNSHSIIIFEADTFFYKALVFFNLDGVSLFFVLSGFLIGGILIHQFETKPASFKMLLSFWIRRWFRTIPAYFLVLTILIIFGLHYKTLVAFNYVKNYYAFLPNFWSPMPEYLFPEAWSLNVEEWFYLLIPLCVFILVAFCRIRSRIAIPLVAVMVIIGVTAFRFYRQANFGTALNADQIDLFFRKQVLTRLDGIMYGVIGAYLAYYHLESWKRYKKALFFIGLLLIYSGYLQYITGYFSTRYYATLAYSVESVGFLCLFPYLTNVKQGTGFVYKLITRLSIISYSMYLLNFSVVKVGMIRFLDANVFINIPLYYLHPVNYACFWLITIVLATLLYKYFEKPLMKLRDNFS